MGIEYHGIPPFKNAPEASGAHVYSETRLKFLCGLSFQRKLMDAHARGYVVGEEHHGRTAV
ncbi:hypothetical protein, partial [Ruthenibacterium lactatiformans]|uniref:hypothetical protein n=1 Tax=Ruthenibacterium lactatiformans TaxID=1550024 RepID=UPI002670DA45